MRQCSKCDECKPDSEFCARYAYCKKCKHANELANKRRELISYGKWRPWSALDDARLMTLCAIGLGVSEISALISRGKKVVYLRIRNLAEQYPDINVGPARHWVPNTPEFIAEVIRLRKELPNKEVAMRLGVTESTVAGAYWRHRQKSVA